MHRLRIVNLTLAVIFVLSAALTPFAITGARASAQSANSQPSGTVYMPLGSRQTQTTGPVGQNASNWSLTFSDEFNSTSLDRNKWRSDYVNGVNGELQEYVDDNSHNNYIVGNGMLKIVARKESYMGKAYTSGIITTQDRFFQKYGFFEIRAKVVKGMGLWPAFWTLPNPSGWPPEIDGLEYLGRQPSVMYFNYHFRNSDGSVGESLTWYNGPDFSQDWHTYGFSWDSNAIVWYLDGVERKRFTDTTRIPNIAMFLVANLAVGGTWPKSPDSTTVFPASYQIDYIRVWKRVQTSLPANTVKNGSFESTGLSPWYNPWGVRNDLGATFSQDSSTKSAGGYSLKANLGSANSSAPWVVSLTQKNFSLTAGQTYSISFSAKASTSRSVRAIVQLQSSPYSEYFNKSVNVTTSWARYSYTFTAPTTTSAAMINFNLASATGSVWIDDVRLCTGTGGCS